jgi:ubiquinone/menaquinone biosynthesis C-methylase UbiE
MGFFTLPAARMVGESGRVIAVDVQERMLRSLRRRAEKSGLAQRIDARVCGPDDIGVSESIDVCLAFNVAHEVPEAPRLFAQIRAVLKPAGKLLLTEPKFHVSENEFRETLEHARAQGLKMIGDLHLSRARSALLEAA